MSVVTVVLERIVCRNTTEAGHDEVYYLSPSIIRRTGTTSSADVALAPGPSRAQGANAGGPGGENTAWDCNDSGELADQRLNVELFPVVVGAGEHVAVTLNFAESDGNNLADVEAQAAAATAAALGIVTAAWPPTAVVTVPAGIAVGVVTGVFQAAKSFLSNQDDPLGAVTFVLEGAADGSAVRMRQVGIAEGSLEVGLVDGSEARISARLQGSDADYSVVLRIEGGVIQTAAALTVDPGTLGAADFVHWAAAQSNGASGVLHGAAVALVGPMGTAFYLHDDYPGFNLPAFTPALPLTGMVELVGAAGHAFTLQFQSHILDPVFHLGSLASTLTFPAGTAVTRLSGSDGFRVAGATISGETATPVAGPDGTLGPSDSCGSVLLTGVFDALAFALTPTFGDSTSQDGVFLQLGGSHPG
jgi:hypothetical protein